MFLQPIEDLLLGWAFGLKPNPGSGKKAHLFQSCTLLGRKIIPISGRFQKIETIVFFQPALNLLYGRDRDRQTFNQFLSKTSNGNNEVGVERNTFFDPEQDVGFQIVHRT